MLLVVLCACASAPAPVAAPPSLTSGAAGGLLWGVDPESGVLTGRFEDATGFDEATGQPRFVCAFSLRAQLAGPPPHRVVTWWPEAESPSVITGEIHVEASADGPRLRIVLDEDHGGCWNVRPFARGGTEFAAAIRGDWRAVRTVAAERAWFHLGPDPGARGSAYVVAGDPVRVYERAPGWVLAEFAGETAVTRGWLREEALYPDRPAASR